MGFMKREVGNSSTLLAVVNLVRGNSLNANFAHITVTLMVKPPIQPKFSHILSSVHPRSVLFPFHPNTTKQQTTHSFHLTDAVRGYPPSPQTAAQKCGSLSRSGDCCRLKAIAWAPSLPSMSFPLRMLGVTHFKNSTCSFPQWTNTAAVLYCTLE